MTKAPTSTEKKPKKQHDNTKTPPKTSITQRLWTDLEQSVGVTTATQLMHGKTGSSLRDPNLPTNSKNCVIKRTLMPICVLVSK